LFAGFIWAKAQLIALHFSDMIGDFGANHSLSRASDFEQRILFRAAQNTTCYPVCRDKIRPQRRIGVQLD